jgi:glutaredoxin
MHVTVYSKPGCHLCEDALLMIDRLAPRYALDVTEVNILDDPAIYEQYREIIPVVEVPGAQLGSLAAPITERELREYFEKARRTVSN